MSEDDSSIWWKIGLLVLAAVFVLHLMGESDEKKVHAVLALCATHGGYKEDLTDEYAPRGKFHIECEDGTAFSGDANDLESAFELEPGA